MLLGLEVLGGIIYSMTALSDLTVEDFEILTFSLISLALANGLLIVRNSNLVSFPTFYFIVFVAYTVSAPVLYTTNGVTGLVYFRALDLDYLARTIPLVIVGMASYTLGVLVCSRSPGPPKIFRAKGHFLNQPPVKSSQAHLIELTALFTLVVSISIVVFETARGQGLSASLSGGYYEYSELRRSGAQSLLYNICMTRLLPISLLTYNAALKLRLRRINISDVFLFLGLSIPLLAGDRGTFLAIFMVWILIHHSYSSPIRFMNLFLAFIGVLLFIPVMQVVRSVGIGGWSFTELLSLVYNVAAADEKFQGKILVAILGPFSSAIMTFMGTLMKIADGESLRFGYDYVANVAAALPGVSSLAPNNSFKMHMFLIPTRQGGPGYMAIAEMFQNFGVLGIALGHFLIGIFLARAQVRINKKNLSVRELAFLGCFFFTLIIWVRNEFTAVSQTIFYFWFLFWFVPCVLAPFIPRKSRTYYQPSGTPKRYSQ